MLEELFCRFGFFRCLAATQVSLNNVLLYRIKKREKKKSVLVVTIQIFGSTFL